MEPRELVKEQDNTRTEFLFANEGILTVLDSFKGAEDKRCRDDTAYSGVNGDGSSFVPRPDAENAGSEEEGLGFSPSDLRQLASQSAVKATSKLRLQKFKASHIPL